MPAAKHESSKHASSKHKRKERRSAERTMARDSADRLAEAAKKREASEAAQRKLKPDESISTAYPRCLAEPMCWPTISWRSTPAGTRNCSHWNLSWTRIPSRWGPR
jgi:hypothetical protein